MVNLCVNTRDAITPAGPRRELRGEPVESPSRRLTAARSALSDQAMKSICPLLYPNQVDKQAWNRGLPWRIIPGESIYESITRRGHGVANFNLKETDYDR